MFHLNPLQGELPAEERIVINSHPYYTHHILNQSKQLRRIADVAPKHQENLDGRGYPFKAQAADIDLDSRVVAVADIFTALVEDRPYRRRLDKVEV